MFPSTWNSNYVLGPPCAHAGSSYRSFALILLPSVLALVLVLIRVGYTQARHNIGQRNSQAQMTYVVKWGREKIRFPLPQPNTPLSELRKEIADYTHLPTESFKLVHAGAVMKDDNAPILAYGIHDGSTISIIGGDTSEKDRHPHRQSEKSAPPERRTEQSTIAQIQSEMDNVRGSLLPGVDRLIAGLKALTSSTSSAAHPQPSQATTSAQAPPTREQEQEHARLGELLLQSLLRLDAINSEGEWTEARKERKGAVKEVQGLLDRLDLAWRTAKGRT